MSLSILDWTIIVAYVLVTLGIGIAFSRRAGKNLNEFFVGVQQRSLPTEMIIVETAQLKIAIVAVLSIAAWLLATFVTKAESTEKLSSFYRRVRPGGWGWKPIARECPEVKADTNLGLSIVATIVSSVLIYSVLPLTGYIIFGEYQSAIVCAIVACISGVATIALVTRLTRE
jgi:hypothetical protein